MHCQCILTVSVNIQIILAGFRAELAILKGCFKKSLNFNNTHYVHISDWLMGNENSSDN